MTSQTTGQGIGASGDPCICGKARMVVTETGQECPECKLWCTYVPPEKRSQEITAPHPSDCDCLACLTDMTQSREQGESAYDEFRERVLNMPSHQAWMTISADLARRMLAEHEEDCDRMERAAEAVENLNAECNRLAKAVHS